MHILETPRLILRELVPDDVDALARILSDRETMRFYPTSFDRPAVKDWIARNRTRYAKDGHGLWAMTLKSTGELIGDCGLTVQDVGGANRIEIGYHVRRDHWGQGFATESARACRDFGFARLPVDRLVSIIRPENLPSRRVAEKIGMTIWKEVMRANLPHQVYSLARTTRAREVPDK
jgi:[ribosomal protein S5]-alanine N-acetyltransferase